MAASGGGERTEGSDEVEAGGAGDDGGGAWAKIMECGSWMAMRRAAKAGSQPLWIAHGVGPFMALMARLG